VGSILQRSVQPGEVLVLHRGWTSPGLQRYYRGDAPIVGAYGPDDLAPVLVGAHRERAVWLVESHTEDPPTLAPHLAATRPSGARWELYGVTLQRFDAPG
jgi:hypothetical protein